MNRELVGTFGILLSPLIAAFLMDFAARTESRKISYLALLIFPYALLCAWFGGFL